MIKEFILMVQFLTRIPIPLKIEFSEEKFGKSVVFMPLVGLLIGGILYALYFILHLLFPNVIVVSLFTVILWICITGGLHLDGLADTFDGIFSCRSKERMLEIMKDSRIGTNGAVALIVIIVTKVILVSEVSPLILVISPVLGRLGAVYSASISNYARASGMGAAIVTNTGIKTFLKALVMVLLVLTPVFKFQLIVFVPVVLLFVYAFTKFIKSKIDGITGDTIGAVTELSEVVVLVAGMLVSKIN